MSLSQLHNLAEKGLKAQLKQLGFDVSGEVGSSRVVVEQCDMTHSSTGYTDSVPTSSWPLHRSRSSRYAGLFHQNAPPGWALYHH